MLFQIWKDDQVIADQIRLADLEPSLRELFKDSQESIDYKTWVSELELAPYYPD